MAGTVDSTNINIITKISSICDIINLFKKNNIIIDKKIQLSINEIKEEYEMGSITILTNYFLIVSQHRNELNKTIKKTIQKEKDNHFLKYQSFIQKENFISKLNRLLQKLKLYTTFINKHTLCELYNILKVYNNSTVQKNIRSVSYELCKCGNDMLIDANSSMLVCKNCGLSKELYGTVFEDDQFYYQEGHRTKHGTYDPSKHCRFWVERIQARETTEIPEVIINSMKTCIIRDKIRNKNQVTCAIIRKYLRQTQNSKYNEHVPLIRKMLTGITPPQLTDYEMQLIHIYFDKVIHIFDEIKPPKKTNCPYHPYFIFKIIEQIIKSEKDIIRKSKILSCIHLQSRNTLVTNDALWFLICNHMPEFNYIPTDRCKQKLDF
jgi:hypothetical protein